MDINRISQVQQIYSAKKAKSAYKAQSNTASKDILNVSSFAHELSIASKAVKNSPDVRTDLVTDIKNRMEQGTYNVKPEDVAKKILGIKE